MSNRVFSDCAGRGLGLQRLNVVFAVTFCTLADVTAHTENSKIRRGLVGSWRSPASARGITEAVYRRTWPVCCGGGHLDAMTARRGQRQREGVALRAEGGWRSEEGGTPASD